LVSSASNGLQHLLGQPRQRPARADQGQALLLGLGEQLLCKLPLIDDLSRHRIDHFGRVHHGHILSAQAGPLHAVVPTVPFSLFNIEAVVIGLLGSALGVIAAIAVGQVTAAALASTILASLPGLTIILFEPATIAIVILGVMAIAFLAGTLPAVRAAKADPIASLRYE
jgi:hypothetical protein